MGRQSEAFVELLQLMQLEPLEVNLFRGVSRDIGTQRVFGGQILAQSLLAACATVDGRLPHSLHGYFLRAGDHEAPVVYQVDRTRDGRSFSSRRVQAIQHGRPIFTFAASFQVQEEGLEHQFTAPDVPPPEEATPIEQLQCEDIEKLSVNLQRWLDRFGPFEFRAVRGGDPNDRVPRPPFKDLWFRLHGDYREEDVRRLKGGLPDVFVVKVLPVADAPVTLSDTSADHVLLDTFDPVLRGGTGRAFEDGSGSWAPLSGDSTSDDVAAYARGYTLGNQHPDFSELNFVPAKYP